MREISWEHLLTNVAHVGHSFEVIRDGVVYCGPIAKIEDLGDKVRVISPWTARREQRGETWEHHAHRPFEIPKTMTRLNDSGGGTISVQPNFGETHVVFPNDRRTFQAHHVRGLPKDSTRLRKLYPTLRFDAKVARDVLLNHGFFRTQHAFSEQPPTTMDEMIALFKKDDQSATEFLGIYIKMITGDDISKLVY